MTMLLEFLERRRARHLFRSSRLKVTKCNGVSVCPIFLDLVQANFHEKRKSVLLTGIYTYFLIAVDFYFLLLTENQWFCECYCFPGINTTLFFVFYFKFSCKLHWYL